MVSEREQVAEFLDLDLLPLVDELADACRAALDALNGSPRGSVSPQDTLALLLDRCEGLYLTTFRLWRDCLRKPVPRGSRP